MTFKDVEAGAVAFLCMGKLNSVLFTFCISFSMPDEDISGGYIQHIIRVVRYTGIAASPSADKILGGCQFFGLRIKPGDK